jgi:hypothetical protein
VPLFLKSFFVSFFSSGLKITEEKGNCLEEQNISFVEIPYDK